MAKLSVCIPVEAGASQPDTLIRKLLAIRESSIEIVTAGNHLGDGVKALALADERLKIAPFQTEGMSSADLWLKLLEASSGDWLTVVHPLDMLEPDLPALLAFIEKDSPDIDVLGWSALHINPDAPVDVAANVAIPMLHNTAVIEKAAMLQAFFQWSGAQRVPVMPFGLYHGAIKRSLMNTIVAATAPTSWLTLSPRYEWSARTLIFAQKLLLSNRPLSAVQVEDFVPHDIPSALQGFPFDARLGITAVIAEIQARVLHELGGAWSGFGPDFVRACLYDCAMEHDIKRFPIKVQRYREAIMRMPGGAEFLPGFQPQYMPHLPADRTRGQINKMLLVDRFIGKARTAQDFYAVVNSMMAPVSTIIQPDA